MSVPVEGPASTQDLFVPRSKPTSLVFVLGAEPRAVAERGRSVVAGLAGKVGGFSKEAVVMIVDDLYVWVGGTRAWLEILRSAAADTRAVVLRGFLGDHLVDEVGDTGGRDGQGPCDVCDRASDGCLGGG